MKTQKIKLGIFKVWGFQLSSNLNNAVQCTSKNKGDHLLVQVNSFCTIKFFMMRYDIVYFLTEFSGSSWANCGQKKTSNSI